MTGRLWRLRRLHQSIDALLVEEDVGDGGGFELRFLLNGSLIFSRRWPDRLPAVEEAAARRGELEREGWMPHW